MSGWLTREEEERGCCSQELNGLCFITRQYVRVCGGCSNASAFRNFFDVVLQHAMA